MAGLQNRRALGWWILAGAIVAEVCALLSLKGALQVPWLYAIVIVGYLTAFVGLALVLRTGMALGVAYGIWGATGVALTAIASLLVFGEPITMLMGVGIVIVIAGVLCVELGSHVGAGKQAVSASSGSTASGSAAAALAERDGGVA